MYRDKALQRATTRERVRRYREKQKALQEGVTKKVKSSDELLFSKRAQVNR